MNTFDRLYNKLISEQAEDPLPFGATIVKSYRKEDETFCVEVSMNAPFDGLDGKSYILMDVVFTSKIVRDDYMPDGWKLDEFPEASFTFYDRDTKEKVLAESWNDALNIGITTMEDEDGYDMDDLMAEVMKRENEKLKKEGLVAY